MAPTFGGTACFRASTLQRFNPLTSQALRCALFPRLIGTVPDELSELKRRCERVDLLHQVSNVIHSTLEPQQALQLVLGESVRLTNASSGSIVLGKPHPGLLQIEGGAR